MKTTERKNIKKGIIKLLENYDNLSYDGKHILNGIQKLIDYGNTIDN